MEKRKTKKYIIFALLFAIFIIPFAFSGCECSFSFVGKSKYLTSPVLAADTSQKILQWYNTDETDVYDVCLNGKVVDTISSASDILTYDYSKFVNSNTEYNFTIVAKSNDQNVADSKSSNSVIINNRNAFLSSSLPSSKVDYSKVNSVATSMSSTTISWGVAEGAKKYMLSLFTNSTGYMEIETSASSYNIATIPGVVTPHQIVAYNISAIYPDGTVAVISPRINYYNPDGNYVIRLVDGYIWDYYINSEEELNAIVYYNFISRIEDYTLTFDPSYANEVQQASGKISQSSAVISQITDAFESFYETCYYKSKKYGSSYCGVVDASKNQYGVSLDFCGVYQCNTNQTINTLYLMNKEDTGLGYYKTYDYETNGSRDVNYDDYISDQYLLTQDVTTSEQLYNAVENKITPICADGSRADVIYSKAKEVLNDIISPSMTDYEKALAIFDWITYETLYDYNTSHYDDNYVFTADCCYYLEGVFLKHVSVCDGFSKAYSLMCNMEGIDCVRIVGTARTSSGTGGHAWNKVKLGDEYYVVDITWTELAESNTEYLAHKYFLVSDYTISASHTAYAGRKKFAMYPTSLTPTLNYYTMANMTYTDIDGEEVVSSQYIDSSQDLINALYTPLLNNSGYVEMAVTTEYLDTLVTKHNTSDYITAFQKEMKEVKFTPQLISQIYDTNSQMLNIIEYSKDTTATVVILNTSLLINEDNELGNIIQYFGDYAKVNDDTLGYDITIGIDTDYLAEKFNTIVNNKTIDNCMTALISEITGITCEYELSIILNSNNTPKTASMYINQSETPTKIYYYSLTITKASATKIATPNLSLDDTTLTWDAVDGATEYEIYVNGEEIVAISSNTSLSYDISSLAVGKYEIYIVAITSDVKYISSDESNVVNYVNLSTPSITLLDSTIYWTGIANASYYEVYIDSTLAATIPYSATTNAYNYTLQLSTPNTYSVYILAVSKVGETELFYNTSNIVEYTIAAPTPTLNTPQVAYISQKTLSWDSVEDAEAYFVHINSNIVDNGTNTLIDLTNYISTAGTYNIYVTATADGYNSSDSNTVTYTKLATPTITLSGTNVSWDGINGAKGYRVVINSTNYTTTYSSYSISNLTAGTYNIYVVATNSSYGYDESDISNTIQYIVEEAEPVQLSAPNITDIDFVEDIITWDSVANATGYKVYIGSSTYTTTDNSIDLTSRITDYEPHNVEIEAYSNMSNYITSERATTTYEKTGDSVMIVDQYVIYENSVIGTNSSLEIGSSTATWEKSDYADYYVMIATNGDGTYEMIDQISKSNTTQSLNSFDIYDSSDIIAYSIISVIDYQYLYVDTTDLTYHNPDTNAYGEIFAFNGDFYDHYVSSQAELNDIVYHSFLWREPTTKVKASSSFASYISESMLDTAIKSFSETMHISYSVSVSEGVSTISLTFGATECETDYEYSASNTATVYEQYAGQKTYYDYYDYTTNGTRPTSYKDWASDKKLIRLSATTSEELLHIVEAGYTPEVVAGSRAETIYTAAKNVLREIISPNMTDYEKALSIFDWITTNTQYDHKATKLTTGFMACPAFYLEGVFVNGLAVCDGFSKAFSLMCNMEGIPCIKVSGEAIVNDKSGGHAWNKVQINGNWYVVDITWTDMLANYDSSVHEFITHEYFLVTDSYISSTHVANSRYTTGYTTPSTPYTYYENTYIQSNSSSASNYAITSNADLLTTITTIANKGMTYIEFVFDSESYSSIDSILTAVQSQIVSYNSTGSNDMNTTFTYIPCYSNYVYDIYGNTGIGVIFLFTYQSA